MSHLVIITGASSGIGQHATHYLAENGFQVAAGVRKESDLKKMAGKNIYPVILDVCDPASIENAKLKLKKQLEQAQQIHLINNAGIAVSGPVEGVPLKKWREQFEVNVFGLISVTQAFLPYIRRCKGRIVNISSVSGLVAPPFLAPYSASKFAVESISDALRRELKKQGVHVIILEPGPVATPIWEKNFSHKEEILAQLSPEILAVYEKDVKKFIKSALNSAKSAVPTIEASKTILKALRSKKPQTRYIVGNKTLHMQAAIAAVLPDHWLDRIIAGQFRD